MENQRQEPQPFTMSAYFNGDEWRARVEDEAGAVVSDVVFGWQGDGSFYDQGLNKLVTFIPVGFGYQGSGAWEELPDGTYAATLYRIDPRFLG